MIRKATMIAIGVTCLLATAVVALEEVARGDRIWFGLGGSALGLALPDLGSVNLHLADRGFDAFGDAILFTGGRGRGGVLGGLSLGGIGWAGETAASGEDGHADLAIGFGGLEVGRVIGGDEQSLLTLGVVIGGGGTSLLLIEGTGQAGGDDGPFGSCGVAPKPLILGRYGAIAAIEPFASLQVQPLHYLGFELHLGYLLPIVSFEWGDAELVGASPRLAGPVVCISATWGAIGRPAIGPILERPMLEETVEQSASLAGPCVEIDNAVGRVTVDVGAESGVHIVAVKRAHTQVVLDQVAVLIEPTRCGLRVDSRGPRSGYWEIEYSISVPVGADVAVTQAVGDVHVSDVSGATSIELGIGGIDVESVVGPSLQVESGAGDIRVVGVVAETIEVKLGTGDIEIILPAAASYALAARVEIGEITVGPFEEFAGIETGGLGRRAEATLGDGAGDLSVRLGIGEIGIRAASD